MNTAMEDAGIVADDINYINAHATSTPVGDVATTPRGAPPQNRAM